MRAARSAASITRHAGGAVTEAFLVAGIVAILALAFSPVYGPARTLTAADNAAAGGKPTGVITVQEPVAHGGTTMATVNPGGTDVYVLVKCYTPALGGAFVYGGYFPVSVNKTATIGPFESYLWTSGGGECTAAEGYFRRSGFGKWVTLAQTSFTVLP
jgi:hypothetical protein